VRAIDPWVNAQVSGGGPPPDWLLSVKDEYFKAGDEFLQELSVPALLASMDRAGVEKAILTVDAERPDASVLAFPQAAPERFFLAASVNPTRHMRGVRALEALVASQPVVMARVVPFLYDLAPDHRSYYPLYAKCIELDLPISINTGIPGPPRPGECQHPMRLDRVCFELPELRVCMAHGADPWWAEAIRLMLKYPNLHLMTSAYLPRYLPPELVHYMNTRGQDRILYASDHPVLSMERCLADAQQLDLRPGVLEKFLYANAEELFFGPRRIQRPLGAG
jgi:predicted TIM-barrel fold metal-dependent hydrolase